MQKNAEHSLLENNSDYFSFMNLSKELESLGLDEKEAKVYVAALEVGKGTAQEIAAKAGISRPTTYFVLERLMKRGLMGTANEEKHQRFLPEDPSRILDLLSEEQAVLERKREKARDLVRELQSVSAAKTNEPIVKYYLGKEGILRMARSVLATKEGEEMWTAYSEDSVQQYLTPEERSRLIQKRVGAKMTSHSIYATETGEPIPGKNGKCVSEKEYPLPADIAVFEDKVRITSFRDEVGIVIRNATVAKTLRSLLKLAHKGISS